MIDMIYNMFMINKIVSEVQHSTWIQFQTIQYKFLKVFFLTENVTDDNKTCAISLKYTFYINLLVDSISNLAALVWKYFYKLLFYSFQICHFM